MSEIILKLNGITKQYGKFKAVDNANFELEKGKIYGFIGQNGAGKTTIIRMITGYSYPNEGSMELFGAVDEKEIAEKRKKIGAIVESPALYMRMTARKNIEIQMELYKIKNKNLPDELLALVGLGDTGKKLVKDFSLGMRQRLAIAMTLVNNPEFVILDEPTNGLDPMGIVEMREMLKRINKEKNITMLISSHILAELHQLATDYIIIDKGRIIETMTMEELETKCGKYIFMQVDDVDKARNVLENVLKVKDYKILMNNMIKVYDYTDDMKTVAKAFFDAGILVTWFETTGDDLETYFINLVTGKEA